MDGKQEVGKDETNSLKANQLVLFGAGMTGRGQVAQLASEDGWKITLVDKNEQLVERLKHADQYTVRLLGNQSREVVVKGYCILHTSETTAINDAVQQANLVVTSVLEPNLKDVATILAPAIASRLQLGIRDPLNVIAAENMGDSSTTLRNYVWLYIPEGLIQDIKSTVGFPNSMISRVVPIADDPLAIITEEYSEWTADRLGVIGEPPTLKGLEWIPNQAARLCRKLYIHNTGHIVCGSLGWLANYHYIHEAAQNPEIMEHIKAAITDSGEAVSVEYSFIRSDVREYENHLLGRLVIPALADDIRRVIRHPVRKLGKEERLVGPLLLCEKHNLPRAGLCYGIAAVLAGSFLPYGFQDYDNQAESIRQALEKFGPVEALTQLSSYRPTTDTAKTILDAYDGIVKKYRRQGQNTRKTPSS